MWDDLQKLKDALDGDNEPEREPAGGSKGQEEVRAEMHNETKKVEQIQKKEGWSDRVSFVSSVIQVVDAMVGRLRMYWMMERQRNERKS